MSRPATRLVIAATMLLPLVVGASASAGPSGGALPPVLIEQLRVADRYGIPADAAMVAANVTAVTPADAGHITVFPCDEDVPATSNINYVAEAIAPNLTLTRISDVGTICVATHAVTDVIVDIVGYVPAGSGITALANPVRFLDSRNGSPTPIPAGTTTEIPIAGVSGVDADADVVLFNLTAIGFDRPGHLTAFPCGEPLPETSSVNYAPSQVVPNLITSRIGENGSVCVHNLAPAEIIVDVAAFATSGITPLPNPVRMIDTRAIAPTAADSVLTIDVAAHPSVPESATAAVYNLTSVGSTAPGFATSYPCDIDRPFVSNLNYGAGQVVANGTITKLSATGELCIYTLAATDLIVDLMGYTEGTTDYVPLTPERIWDSREGWQRTCDWLLHISDRVVLAVNSVTGESARMSDEAGRVPGSRPAIDADCEGVVWLQSESNDDVNGYWSQRFDGQPVKASYPEIFDNTYVKGLHVLGDRIVVSDDRGAIRDAHTGEQLWAGPDSKRSVHDLELSRNGVAVISTRSSTVGMLNFEVWDIFVDTMLYSSTFPQLGHFDVSPEGRYIVIDLPYDKAADDGGGVLVMTAFGDVIDGFGLPVFDRYSGPRNSFSEFAGNGSLLVCVTFNGFFEWDLFGELRPLVDPQQHVDATGGETCSLYV